MLGISLVNSIIYNNFWTYQKHLKRHWIWWPDSLNRLSNKPVRRLQTFIVLCIVSTAIWLWKETFIFALASATIFVVLHIHEIGPILHCTFWLWYQFYIICFIYYIALIFLERWVVFQKLIQPYTTMSSFINIWNVWISTNNFLWICWQSCVLFCL